MKKHNIHVKCMYCRKGKLNTTYPSDELTSLDGNRCITLDSWHQASKISFKSVMIPFAWRFATVLSKSAENVVELTSSDETCTGITMWVHNSVYSNSDEEMML